MKQLRGISGLASSRRMLRAVGFVGVFGRVATATLVAQPAVVRARLVQELRLDATVEDLPGLSRVFVAPRGQILVPVSQDMRLRVFDSTGARAGSVGRRGSGPGEFMQLFNLGWKADTIWVNDTRQRRVTYISPALAVLRSAGYDRLEGDWTAKMPGARTATLRVYGGVSPLAIYADGSVLFQALVVDDSTKTSQSEVAVLVRSRPTGARNVLLTLPPRGDERSLMTFAGFERPVPFVATPQLAISRDGDRLAHMTSTVTSRSGGTFTVSQFGAGGDTSFVRTFSFRGVPIPPEVRDSALAAMLPRPGSAREGPADLPQQFQAIARRKIPAIYPGVQSLLLGLDHTLWVELHGNSEGQPVLALNGKGEPIASIIVPKGSRLRQASASQVWITETDSDGLTSIVRYRVLGIP